jgi:hypothetical protein
MKKTLSLLLSIVTLFTILSAALALPAEFQGLPLFPWLSYTLCVTHCAEYEDTQNQLSATSDSERLVQVGFNGLGNDIAYSDIEEFTGDMFVLRDPSGEEHAAGTYIVHGIDFADGQFSTNPAQKGFELIFAIPKDIALDDLVLLVDTEVANERVIVRMSEAPREVPEA